MRYFLSSLRFIVLGILCLTALQHSTASSITLKQLDCDSVQISWSNISNADHLQITFASGEQYNYFNNDQYTRFTLPNGHVNIRLRTAMHPDTAQVLFTKESQTVASQKIPFNDITRVTALNANYNWCKDSIMIEAYFDQKIKPVQDGIAQAYVRFTIENTTTNQHETIYVAGNNLPYAIGYFTQTPYDPNATYRCTAMVVDANKQGTPFCDNQLKTIEGTIGQRYALLTPTAEVIDQGGVKHIKVSYTPFNACDVAVQLRRYDVSTQEETTLEHFNYNSTTHYYIDNTAQPCHTYYYQLVAPELGQSSEHSAMININGATDSLEIGNFNVSKGDFADKVVLEWELSYTSNVEQVNIFRRISTDKGAFQQIATLKNISSKMSYTDNTTILGAFYIYYIEAKTHDCSFVSSNNGGFTTALATVMGKVTYEEGQSTPDVIVEARIADEHAKFTKQGSFYHDNISDNKLGIIAFQRQEALTHFTWQAWIKPYALELRNTKNSTIYEQKGIFAIKLNNKQEIEVCDSLGATLLRYNIDSYYDFLHLSISKSDSLRLYINGAQVASCGTAQHMGTKLTQGLLANNRERTQSFEGYIDDMRLWNKALTGSEILRNHITVLSGEEEGLIGYWKFDEQGINIIVDYCFQRTLGQRKNHGALIGGEAHSTTTPTQLRYMSYTDAQGNYKIGGIPFENNGTTYRIVPVKAGNTFVPSEKLVMCDRYNALIQDLNFTDNSSYNVYVRVLYDNTQVPAKGIMFTIDGQLASNQSGAIETDNEGYARISVPIGEHTIAPYKADHIFSKKIGNGGGSITRTFHTDIEKSYALQFTDSTRVRLLGRIVGGNTEGNKPLGFGKSVNNIGATTLELRLKGDAAVYPLTASGNSESTTIELYRAQSKKANHITYETTPRLTSVATAEKYGSRWQLSIAPDPTTGEYAVDLLPEEYEVVAINHYAQKGGNSFGTFESIDAKIDTTMLAGVSSNPDSIALYLGDGTAAGYEHYIDTLKVDMHRNFVLYNAPEVFVSQVGKNNRLVDYFGEPKVAYPLFSTATTDSLTLYENGNYLLNNTPVYLSGRLYSMLIRVREIYRASATQENTYNCDNGQLYFTSTLAGDTSFVLNGRSDYYIQFASFNPNLDGDHKRYISIYVQSDGANYYWQPNLGSNTPTQMGAYVLGSQAVEGTRFVTKGPDAVAFVLHDPPGSNSSATLEKGFSYTTYESKKDRNHYGPGNDNIKFKGSLLLGAGMELKNENEIFLGAAIEGLETPVFEFELLTGFTLEGETYNFKTEEWEHSTTFTESISTPTDPIFVGSDGDLFIGNSTNIAFAQADFLSIKKDSATGQLQLDEYSEMTQGTEFATTFYYTRRHIERVLIPTLEELIASKLVQSNAPEAAPAATAFAEGEVAKYLTHLAPSDPNFGRPGTYRIHFNPALSGTMVADKVSQYRAQIDIWKKHLANDEKKKIEAAQNSKDFPKNEPNSTQKGTWYKQNISFDAAHPITQTYESSKQESEGSIIGAEFMVYGNVEGEIGIAGFITKFDVEIGNPYQLVGYECDETINIATESESCKISYTLHDGCDGNYYSTDIYTQNGQSPIFKVMGGVTSCPHFPGEKTKYYTDSATNKPATLHLATVAGQQPEILINNLKHAPVLNIEAGSTIQVPITITEKSAAPAGLVYAITTLPNNQLNGLQVEINKPTIMLEGNTPLTVHATIRQGRTDISEYDSVGIVVHSLCQYPPLYYGKELIADTAYLKLSYKPMAPVSQLKINQETNIVNLECDSVQLRIEGFDMLNYQNLTNLAVEYRNEGSLKWETAHYYAMTADEYTANKERYSAIDSVTSDTKTQQYIDHLFRFSDAAPDGTYQVRVRADIKSNNIVLDTRYSSPVEVIKDKTAPTVVATSPADGILDLGDAIELTFNEAMYPSQQLSDFIAIKGVLNGQTDNTGNDRALQFNGIDMYAQTDFSYNLSGKSFTIEGLIYPDKQHAGVIFQHGEGNNSFTIGINNEQQIYVEIMPENLRSTFNTKLYTDRWSHIAVVYNATTQKVQLMVDNLNTASNLNAEGYLNFELLYPHNYIVTAPFTFGNNSSKTLPYKGLMRNFRIWEMALTPAQIEMYRTRALSGNEVALLGYWKMDELSGNRAIDHARSHHLNIHADWYIYPGGLGVKSSADNFIALPNPAIAAANDYTLDFWFKATAPQQKGTIVAKTGSNNDAPLALYALSDNTLQLCVNGQSHTLNTATLDNQWHHVALSVNRASNANLYIDGQLAFYMLGMDVDELNTQLTLGATLTVDGATTQAEHTLNAHFDNVRIWNYALSQKHIASIMHERSASNAMGLHCYYPFDKTDEHSGNTDLMPWMHSIADATSTYRAHTYIAEQGAWRAIQDSTAIVSTEAALISTYVNYETIRPEYTHKNDALILSLSEFDSKPYRIQNAELTAYVSNMRDLHGNYMQPYEWSFVVNNKHLLWDSKPLTLRKHVGTSTSFDVTFYNRSGQTENFSIENLPLWLTASETIGSIAPLEERTITFTTSAAQPVGSYEECIYLVGEGNLIDKLQLNVTVYKEQPRWEPVFNTDLTMNVIAEVEVDGCLSAHSESLLAAFINDSCVGVASPDKAMGNLYWMTLSYPRNSGKVAFKFWDASKGIVYSHLNGETILFSNGAIKGTPSKPVHLRTGRIIEQHIPLQKGWSWISTNVVAVEPRLESVFESHTANVSMVKSQLEMAYYDTTSHAWVGTLSLLQPQLMYAVQSRHIDLLKITGVTTSNLPITLHKPTSSIAWNWIGYTPQDAMPIGDALAQLEVIDGEMIKGQKGFAIYDEQHGWMGTLTMLEPGCGYQYRTLKERTFTYPATAPMRKATPKMASNNTPAHFTTDPYAYPNSMNVFAIVANYPIAQNDELGIFFGNECRGIGKAYYDKDNNRYLFAAHIYGETDGEQLSYRIYDAEKDREITLPDQLTFTTNNIVGTPSAPIVLNNGSALTSTSANRLSIYPNPFVDIVHIAGAEKIMDIRVKDTAGRTIYVGTGSALLNLSHLESGCYIINITTNKTTHVKTIIKL